MRPIFLIGYMAVGKTTFGRALASRLGLQFIDLDFYIEQRFHTTVKEIFASRGEAAFRQLESEMLHEVGEMSDVVVSCGGGTPCSGSNMEYMNAHGLTVRLTASEDCLVRRLVRKRWKRPLIADKTEEEIRLFIRGHQAQREPWYSQASETLESDELENAPEISTTLARFLERHPELLGKGEEKMA